jgi:hypothetical protein
MKFTVILDPAQEGGYTVSDAKVSVWPTTADEQGKSSPVLNLPDGLIVSTDRRSHGAEVHLNWDQARALSNEILRLLAEHDSRS